MTQRVTTQHAHEFATSWLRAWNAHDLDALLAHFAEDASFTSPVAAQLLPETGGVLRGKDEIRRYWAVGLERIPDLHFEIENVYAGLSTIVINYRNHTGALVAEVLQLGDGGLVVRGEGTYLADDAAASSGVQAP
jgi:hypothetical protein